MTSRFSSSAGGKETRALHQLTVPAAGAGVKRGGRGQEFRLKPTDLRFHRGTIQQADTPEGLATPRTWPSPPPEQFVGRFPFGHYFGARVWGFDTTKADGHPPAAAPAGGNHSCCNKKIKWLSEDACRPTRGHQRSAFSRHEEGCCREWILSLLYGRWGRAFQHRVDSYQGWTTQWDCSLETTLSSP